MLSVPLTAEMGPYSMNFTQCIRDNCIARGDRTAYRFIDTEGRELSKISFSELSREAESVAHGLRQHIGSGRALLLYSAGIEFVKAFLGCLYAGLQPVVANPPSSNHHGARLLQIATDAEIACALMDDRLQARIEQWFADSPKLAEVPRFRLKDLPTSAAAAGEIVSASIDDVAFLQYSSGSTGDVKGVAISHRNILHNLAALDQEMVHDSDSVMVSWLPHFHDMGLVYGILMSLYKGFSCCLLAPQSFLSRPAVWLETISRYRGTHTAAPNFAFDLCVTRIPRQDRETLDLSSWHGAINGAEPIRAETLKRFADAFAASGFSLRTFCPGYGLAETTLMVSVTGRDEEPYFVEVDAADLARNEVTVLREGQLAKLDPITDNDRKTIVSCGNYSAHRMLIVDPQAVSVCAEGRIGEIWVAGPSIAAGYWRQSQATHEAFSAITTDGEGPFLRTGDLGFVHGQRLYVTGRLKEIIVLRGVNYYPHHIEHTASTSHPALRVDAAAAFGIEGNDGERLVIVLEIKRDALRSLDAEAVIAEVRAQVAEQQGLRTHAVVLIRPASLPKTSSGKTQRAETRRRFLDGSLATVAEWRDIQSAHPPVETKGDLDRAALGDWLATYIGRIAGIEAETLDRQQPLSRFGLESIDMVELATALSRLLGREVDPTIIYDHPTIERLEQHLVQTGRQAQSTAVPQLCTEQPIAIVGMACRFPQAPDLDAFWRLLMSGTDAISPAPAGRFPMASELGTPAGGFRGGYLQDVDLFDADFFGIADVEAASMDPQQRLLLEVAWQALEAAGIVPASLAGTATGVYVGASTTDYSRLQRDANGGLDRFSGTGNALSIVANRLSYLLDLRGPSVAVDTACSSSLVAVHQACQALRTGEISLAIVGGVNLLLSVDLSIVFGAAQMLADDGRCKTFDAAANGYGRGEGCGVVVLKPLELALRDGDNVLAVVRASAVNQDGRSNGLTAPNGNAQAEVIRTALQRAGIAGRDVQYLEAHGTGTPLGDPIELRAAGTALECDRREAGPLLVGSVKTNIGHLEAAAGIAGLIKLVLAIDRATIPGQLHFADPNPHFAWDKHAVRVVTAPGAWPTRQRIGAVSSFGFGGTNAHVVVSAGPEAASPAMAEVPPGSRLLLLSARDDAALMALTGEYREWLLHNGQRDLACIAASAAIGRSHYARRMALLPATIEDAMRLLDAAQRGQRTAGLMLQRGDGRPPKLAWLFSGQGSQYPGMAQSLYRCRPVFRDALDECARLIDGVLEQPLLDVMFGRTERAAAELDNTAYAQVCIFALQVALARLWQSIGIRPAALLGHSVGQYAAAYVAGAFELADGLKLIAARGRMMGKLSTDGMMIAVRKPIDVVTALIEGADRLEITADNGSHTVVGGARHSVETFLSCLEAEGIKWKALNTSHAFHTALIEPALDEFEAFASTIAFKPLELPLVCNLSGRQLDAGSVLDAAYWKRHARKAVRFRDGVATLAGLGCDLLLELGPDTTLANMAAACWPGDGLLGHAASLRRDLDDDRQFAQAVAELYVNGAAIDYRAFYGDRRQRIALPGYPFQRRRHWVAPGAQTELGRQTTAAEPKPGMPIALATGGSVSQQQVVPATQPWFRDHLVFDQPVVPAAQFTLWILQSAADVSNIEKLAIHRPLVVSDDGRQNMTIQVVVDPADESQRQRVRLFSCSGAVGNGWQLHAEALLVPATQSLESTQEIAALQRGDCVDAEVLYHAFSRVGIKYGPAFRPLRTIWYGDSEALGVFEQTTGNTQPVLTAALLDGCFQVAMAASGFDEANTYVPIGWRCFQLWQAVPAASFCHVKWHSGSGRQVGYCDIWLLDAAGEVWGKITDLRVKQVTPANLFRDADELAGWLYVPQWQPVVAGEGATGFWPAPRFLTAALSEHDGDEGTRFVEDGSVSGDELLERLAVAYAQSALETLGWRPLAGESVDAEILADRLGIAGRHRRLFRRMLQILATHGVLTVAGSEWHVDTPASVDPGKLFAETYDRYPDLQIQLTLLQRCGERLGPILRGEHEALPLLFPERGVGAEELYRDAPAAHALNTLARQVVAGALPYAPGERPLRVLEIGAGTGGTTHYLLPLLGRSADYDYTDISPAFFANAREKFSDHPGIRFRVLDIERDPAAQGFERHSYDLVIASNVLHATRDLEQTLSHVEQLLTRSGMLLLVEGVRRCAWLDLTFGLLEGWWRFADAVREDHALLELEQWKRLLEHRGFELASVQSPGTSSQAVIVARAARQATWLLVGPGDAGLYGAPAALAGLGRCVRVEPAVRLGRIDATRYQLPFSSATDWAELIGDLERDGIVPDGVVYIPGGDDTASGDATDRLPAAVDDECAKLLALVQALAHRGQCLDRGLWILTESAGEVRESGYTALIHAPLLGMARVIALEHPALVVRSMEVTADTPPTALAALFADPPAEDELRWCASGWRAARLARAAAVANPAVEISHDGCYLITGGLGGLGIALAEWLVRHGATRLVINGRRPPAAAAAATLSQLRDDGVDVRIMLGDVADEAVVEGLLADIAAHGETLAGVFDLVGVLHDGTLVNQTPETFASVLRPKVSSAWHLHRLTLDQSPPLFVMFSSIVSVLGNTGQGNHAAANRFLDALAEQRRGMGLTALSINWGGWSEIGAAASNSGQIASRFSELGIGWIDPAAGFETLQRILAGGVTQAVVAPIAWDRFTRQFASRSAPSIVRDFMRPAQSIRPAGQPDDTAPVAQAPGPTEIKVAADLLDQIHNAEQTQDVLISLLETYFIAKISKATGFVPTPSDFDRSLIDMGVDSLMAQEFKQQLINELGVDIPIEELIGGASLEGLVSSIDERLQLERLRARITAGDDATTNAQEVLTL